LKDVKTTIEHHEANLTRIPDAITQKKQEILTKVKEDKAIHSSLANIFGSAEEDKQQVAEVDVLRQKALEATQNALSL
jgi:hypothetical protein